MSAPAIHAFCRSAMDARVHVIGPNSRGWVRLRAALGALFLLGGPLPACVAGLDTFVHNATHCSFVGPATCEEQPNEDIRICTACDAPYPWEAHGVPASAPERIDVTLADGETNDAWFIPSSGAHPDITLVYTHGNRSGIEHYLNRIGLLYQLGYNLYVPEYRGYGKSSDPNEPSEPQLYDDIERARAALKAHLGDDEGAVFYYGYSVGALPAVHLAVAAPPCALLLEAPWPSVQAFSNDSTHVNVPASFLTIGEYDNIAKISRVEVPLQIVHGTADDFVLIEHSETLLAAANEPKALVSVEGAGHGNGGQDIPTVMGDAYLTSIEAFFAAHDCR